MVLYYNKLHLFLIIEMERTNVCNTGLKKLLKDRRDQLRNYFKTCPQALDYIDLMERSYGDHALGWAMKLHPWQWLSIGATVDRTVTLQGTIGECNSYPLIAEQDGRLGLTIPYDVEFKILTLSLHNGNVSVNTPNLNSGSVPRRGGLMFWLADNTSTAIQDQYYTQGLFNSGVNDTLPHKHSGLGDGPRGVVVFGHSLTAEDPNFTYGVTNGLNNPNAVEMPPLTQRIPALKPFTTNSVVRIKELIAGQIEVILDGVRMPLYPDYSSHIREMLTGRKRTLGVYFRAGDTVMFERYLNN